MGSAKAESAQNNVKNAVKPYGKVILTLKNKLLPEEKLSPTPSQNDGLDIETETDLRIYGCELIQTAGILLKLPQVAMATGQVLLQRFYYSKSLVRHPVDHTAMACVCLASKIEEAPRRVRDVINVFTHIRQVNSNKTIQPVILDVNYIQLKNLVIKAERRVLKELGFCVHIKHPHKIIVMYLQVLGYEKNQKLMQYSWNYMNDSLRTDVFVRYQPETVACACIYLTARKLQLPLPKNPSWYSIFGATEAEVRDIAIRILKLYNRPKPNIEQLERKVEELCKQYHDARVKARGNSGNNTPNNDSSSPNTQKTAGAHNAWGGFISRSGSHIAPPVSEKRSRSRSGSHSPVSKHNHKRSKKHRSRSRSPSRNHKKNHKRRSYSRSRSNSPHKTSRKGREKRRSTSPVNDREGKNDRYIDRYDKYEKYEKERYSGKEERERERYDEKKERHDKREDKYKDKEEKYREDRDKYKKSKHEKDIRERSKDRRR
ncbi:cyclin-L1 [Tribolium castaneum]|uniref:Cyclin-L1-like Protein n=1 Tax=Tribolium castaneum TaxID=7070 RepID=D2A481_TRICA|nr:PREDICTED: cyclin-L1 [Tribolium castaneum]EFA05631.1 Cyclin-L1-like Protein [Tribolium castaneum]|eukprot:XP_008195033.1 PREDICTED: cyclin-L1 [Tribolium castaneum]